MLNQQTMSILHSLKLFGLARGFEERLANPKQASLSHAEFVGLLVQDEKTYRDNLRLRRHRERLLHFWENTWTIRVKPD